MEAVPDRPERGIGARHVPTRDVERVNSLLREDLRFDVEGGAGTGGVGHPSRAPATGTLIVELGDGSRLAASHPVSTSASARRRFHSLAGALAECAMTLGLGAAIYRKGA